MAQELRHIPSKPEFSYRSDAVALLRAYVVSAQRYADDYAARHDMHPTDMQAMAVLHQAQQEGISLCAGGLGRALSLSSPATSALLDRLESQGRITRSRDRLDHRKVVITLEPRPLDEIIGFFEPLGASVADALKGCGDLEVSAIVDFLERLVSNTDDLVGNGDTVAPAAIESRAGRAAV